jgi:cytochrome c biogenesis protein CcdA
MILFVLAYLGGALTIVSPCILKRAVADLKVTYPVAIDNNYAGRRPSGTIIGQPTTLSTPKAASATTISAKTTTTIPSAPSTLC